MVARNGFAIVARTDGATRLTWRRIHLGIDKEPLEIRAVEITGSHVGGPPILPDLLDQIPGD